MLLLVSSFLLSCFFLKEEKRIALGTAGDLFLFLFCLLLFFFLSVVVGFFVGGGVGGGV